MINPSASTECKGVSRVSCLISGKTVMFGGLFILLAAATAARAAGDFVILHSPDSVAFHGNEEVEQSLLKEVFAAALGFTVKPRGMWTGMSITDPFQLPEAVVAVVVEGIDSLETPRGEKFPLIINEAEETTWQALRERCEERGSDNTLVRFSLADGLDALGQSALGELKPAPIDKSSLKSLNLENEEDTKFLEELQLMRAIAKNVPHAIKSDSKPDIYWLVVSGIGPITETYGKNSSATRETLSLLSDALNAISDAFIKAYDGKVVIAVFTNDATQARHTRSVIVKREKAQPKDVIASLAAKYDANYPVVFNIVLWFGVVFFFSLLAICIAIADMDPGRDSIIYRMTSNRMKKDN